MTFTNEEYGAFRTFVETSYDNFKGRGLRYDTDDNLEAYSAALSNAGHYISVPHDPCSNHLTPENSYWGKLLDPAGEVVAGHAQQLIQTRSMWHEIQSGRLYADRKPGVVLLDQGFYEDLNFPDFGGRIVFGGSAWIHPDWRNRNHSESLYQDFMALSRAISIRHWDADYYVALFKDTPNRRHLGLEGADFENAITISNGPSPANEGRVLPLILMWSSRDYIIKRIYRTNFLAESAVDDGILRYRIA